MACDAYDDDKYIRDLLVGRERWGVFLSLTAVAALLLFLSEHPHQNWVKCGPLFIVTKRSMSLNN